MTTAASVSSMNWRTCGSALNRLLAGFSIRKLQAGFMLWVSDRLGFGLTILSAAAKLPVAFTVFYGLLGMPGDKVCSVF